jgi:hypothetical protein
MDINDQNFDAKVHLDSAQVSVSSSVDLHDLMAGLGI